MEGSKSRRPFAFCSHSLAPCFARGVFLFLIIFKPSPSFFGLGPFVFSALRLLWMGFFPGANVGELFFRGERFSLSHFLAAS